MISDEAPQSHSQRLADFVAALDRDAVPEAVVAEAKRALIDWIAAALAGCELAAAGKVHSVIRAQHAAPLATVVGTDLATSAPLAALGNAYASHLQDYDDVFNPPETTVHLGSCVWPAVLALGETRGFSGRDAIASYLAGFEVGARVGIAAGVTHFESSWQVSGTAGHVAAAGAAARALRLPGAKTVNALGIAAAQASGIREVYGTDTKALQPAKAAMDGVLTGLLAEAGLTSSPTALEGQRGLLNAVSIAPDREALVSGLGHTWHVLSNGHKLYPSASLNHPAVDAAIALHHNPDLPLHDIATIEIRMLPFAASVTSLIHPDAGAAAKFSTPHCIAMALLHGRLGLEDFTAEAVDRPEIARLRETISVISDHNIAKRSATLTITLRDGRTLQKSVTTNRGTPENPLTDQELENKLYEAGSGLYPPSNLRTMINSCWDLDFITDMTQFLEPLRINLAGVA